MKSSKTTVQKVSRSFHLPDFSARHSNPVLVTFVTAREKDACASHGAIEHLSSKLFFEVDLNLSRSQKRAGKFLELRSR
ncbi:hypothetical protein Bpfe_029449 [Biomphalaria pfeifferi]|uniref:Uncharacterized protein n=1 Tax=Biomphalaria pfeifferi TaxID=112525 RepID=A0AAD8ARK9_BIOPF|nr:hypothetical protein Bpfe_029449 [Biomphalaria pfeifferi]